MENFTRAGIFDLTLVIGYTVGAFLLVNSLLSTRNPARDLAISLIRFLGGLALIVSLLVIYSAETSEIFPIKKVSDAWSVLLIGGAAIVGVGIGDFSTYRVTNLLDATLAWMTRAVSDNWFVSRIMRYSGTCAVFAVSVAVVLVAIPEIKRQTIIDTPPSIRQTPGFELLLEATYPLPGSPMALVFRGGSQGYITLAQGQVIFFELPEEPGGDFRTRVVAGDLDFPRGLTILNDVLYVVDLGPLPCPQIRCSGRGIEAQILEESNGSIFAFDVLPDGSLGDRRTLLTGLPAANFMHGPNGIAVGPDGLLYVSIGGSDPSFNAQAIGEENERPNLELLGTIIRFNPDGSGLEIFAEGLRNVYGLTFDDKGLLYGVDNDGQTRGGWRREEVLQIKRGANYGYPYEGTFGPHQIRNDDPIWIIDGVGAAGIAWAERFGLRPGLLIGTTNQLHYLELTDYEDGRFLKTRNDSHVIATIPGSLTIVEPGQDQNLIVGAFGANSLFEFKLEIDQSP